MHPNIPRRPASALSGCIAALLVACGGTALAQQNIVQPGDPVIASSANSPGSEGVANAIDGKPTKYLNFDTRTGGKPSGFIVTPSVGVTRVTGISLQSANDAPERDPKVITIEGSNDAAVTGWDQGNWEQITRIDNVPAFGARFQTQTLSFANLKAYKHYRFTVLETQTINGCCFQIAEVGLLGSLLPQDVTQPGDPVIASSSNSPGSEGVANIIDGKPTKYLNFDTRTGGKPSGFIVSPSLGRTVVTGVTIQSANDAPERDAKVVTIEGSNDDTVTGWAAGNWEQVTRLDNIPAYTARFQTQTFLFDNYRPYRHYRFTVLETQTINGCCFQAAEVELLGTGAPQDVTQPGDPIIASSSNSPGSEGVANIIDGKPTKYLNFDTRTGGKPSGFVVTPSIGATTVTGMTMQSANDAPERDPKIVVLEGSNDDVADYSVGTWEQVVRLDNIPAFTARFQTQEFFFPNVKAYKHYRFTVLETQTVNGCCFQMAEVELLAVSQGVDCAKARFLTQPENTLVLNGSPATFVAVVNGPWPLQWYRNGQPIAGATSPSYTTGPVTAANASDVYTVQIKGCEFSSPAQAILFTPSATQSIGISFRGGGANGAPTLVGTNAVTGIFPQAYWNDAANTSAGTLPDAGVDPAVDLLTSDGTPSTITFDFQTSGTWGAGTGDASPTARILNGLVHQQPNSSASGLTFGNVPAGRHSVIVYTVGIPLQFQDADYTITGKNTETYYTRVINADEYNAAPGFYRGISKDPARRSLASFVRFDNVEAGADGTINLNWVTVTPGFDRGAPVNAIQLILNATPAPQPPVIATQPQPTVAPASGVAQLSVSATGTGLTYQWRKNGRNLPDGGNIVGARTARLTINAFSEADEAVYSVAVFNAGGSVVSANASARLSKYNINDQLVAYWKFDETSGNTAANSAAGGKPAAVNGSAFWSQGRVGNAFGFDGATYLLVDSFAPAKRQIAGSAWVNIPEATFTTMPIFRNAQGALGVGAGVGPGTPAGQFEFGIVVDATTGEARLQVVVGVGPNLLRASAPATFLGAWHHVAFSADGAQLRLYVDGVQVASTDYLGAFNTPEVPHVSFGAQLNRDEAGALGPDATNPNFLTGSVDDVGLWTRGLSAEEVGLIYAAGLASQGLTSVTLAPPPVQPGTLSVSFSGGNVTVSWDRGVLQTATAPNGPWTDAVGNGTVTESASGAVRFYRTVVR